MMITKEFISKTTWSVIPACLVTSATRPHSGGLAEESRGENPSDLFGIVKKDAGQASMTEHLYACDFTYGLISKLN